MKWETLPLGEISQVYSGFAFRSQDLGGIGIPVLKIGNIQNKRVSPECAHRLPEELCTEKMRRYFLQPDDTLIAMTGAGSVGKVGKMPRNPGRFLVNQRVAIVRPDPSLSDPSFVYFALSQGHYETQLYSLGLGAGQPNVSAHQIAQLRLPFPRLPVQRRIGAILSAYDDLIENNQRRIRILEEMARSLYREWFVNFRFPGHEKVKFVSSPLGRIPEGWEVKRLGDIATEVRRGIDPAAIEPNTPYIGLEHMPRKSIALSEWGTAEEVLSTKLVFKKGEILFGKIRPYFHKVGVAPLDGVCSTDAIVITPNRPEHDALIMTTVSSDEFVAHATQTAQGTKMPRANWEVLTQYPLSFPPPGPLSKFNSVVRDAVALIELLIFKSRNLRRTRDLLLPRLLGG